MKIIAAFICGAVIATLVTLTLAVTVTADNSEPDHPGINQPDGFPVRSNLEHAMSTCQYGSEMFYVARNVTDAQNLAITDCYDYLETNGERWFIEFYGIQE